MNESQAREIFAFAESFAGLNDKEPSAKQYDVFLHYVIEPIFYSSQHALVLKKYSIDNSASLMAELLLRDADSDTGFDLRQIFKNAIQAVRTLQSRNQDLVAFVRTLAKYLRNNFWWKITEMEKSLRTTLQASLNHKKFEHSGEAGSLFSSRNYWPFEKGGWDVFEGDLDGFENLYPPGKIAAYPEGKTQLPYPSELREALLKIFTILNQKVWYSAFLEWLNSDDSPYHQKTFDPNTDQPVALSGAPDENEENSKELIARAEELLSELKPQYQQTFKTAFIWYKNNWSKNSLGYKELELVTGKKSSTLQEQIKKIENPLFIKRLMENSPQRKDWLREVLEHFRKKYSEQNPEITHPELFRVEKKP